MALTIYSCRLLPAGTGTASSCLAAMLSAWAASRHLTIAPGTLNLCADRAPILPGSFESLAMWASLAQPAWRRDRPGFDPRLYPVTLPNDINGWIFRWSAPADLRIFTGEAEGCPPERRLEVVAPVYLRDALRLRDGDEVVMQISDAGQTG